MGCAGSSQAKGDGNVKKIRKPKPWKHPQPITKTQLIQLREEFWDTAPHYGGRKVLPGKHAIIIPRTFTFVGDHMINKKYH
ncbi:hypothetical protein TIFTF001_023478 [Ficus carica]|uniref:DC-UbP/UBTD2 N-terminal domain-containing protein n=1 Tax=Ficus carica TaxID=3494 RepID=A0AA88DFB5_FICCA|nr:hypothetical protein TIFTF001_023478 [Ficus carica]